MANPFKDQFLKKGLVTKKQARRASHEQRIAVPKKTDNKIKQAREEQAARDRQLNLQQNEAAKEREVQGQIREIIKQNLVEVKGDVSYHFADGKKIQKLYVSKEIVDALSSGKVAIVEGGEQYFILPAKAALQIKERKAEALILLNSSVKKELDPDDPYAEFPIPEDYEW